MNKDEIIEMAKQVGFEEHQAKFDTRFEPFAKLVAEKAIKEALAQTQEPVAWEQFHEHMAGPFYKAPPQPEQEPLAWISTGPARMIHWTSDKPAYGDDWVPLYTTQRMAKRIEDLETEQDCVGWFGYDTGLRLWFETNKGDDGAIPLYKARSKT